MPRPRSKPPAPKLRPVTGKAKPSSGAQAAPAFVLPPRREGEKRVLHIGWKSAVAGRLPGDFKSAEWTELRLDLSAAVKPDIVGRPERLDMLPDAGIDAIYMPQLLQRFPAHHVAAILNEAKRVLVQGGLLAVTVPNVQLAASYVATGQPTIALYPTAVGPITPLDLIYGLRVGQAKGQEQDYHRFGFTPHSIGLILRDFGYSNIHVNPRNHEILATARVYAFDHPERVEKISIARGEQEAEAPQVAAPPVPKAAAAAVSQPRFAEGGRGLPDELDLPPLMWKVLGLEKK